jgi:acyl dehydratase
MTLQTAANQALIYRLSGDYNPLHSDPATAARAGFARPILHGLASMGMAGHALHEWARQEEKRLKSLRGRLAAPVFPGERLRLDAWRESERLLFRVRNEGEKDVVSLGVAEFHYMG